MDVALCGGGDPNQGYTDTAVQLSPSAVDMVKAAIFMGDPMFRAGLPYDAGTCTAGGVRVFFLTSFVWRLTLIRDSLMHVRLALSVRPLRRSSRTVMLRIRIAAMVMMRRSIRDMDLSMARRHWILLRVSCSVVCCCFLDDG